MQALRKRMSLCPVIILSIVFVIACLLLYGSSNPVEENKRSWLPKDQTNLESRKLVQLLGRASMSDRTVILTIVNQTWATPGSILDLFLESFRIGLRTKRLLNHLVIVSADDQAFQYCESMHPHCFHLNTSENNFASGKASVNIGHLKLHWRKIQFLREVLDLGYNFIYTDADVMWFRNPFAQLNPQDEIQIACDFYMGDPQNRNNKADGGFFYVKSNAISIEFFKYWYMAMVLHPNSDDQSVFDIIKHDQISEMLGLQFNYLDTVYFSGFCQPSKEMNEVCTMHANCCDSTESKIHDLRLVLDDWKNFTAPSEEKNSLKGSFVPSLSRAPSKCKW